MEENWWEGFYRRPALWLLGWIPIVTMWLSAVMWKPSVHVGGMTHSWNEIRNMLGSDDHTMKLYGVGLHLLPLGFELEGPEGWFGFTVSMTVQSNLIIGLVFLLIGIVTVGIISRDTNNAVYVAGPFWAYSLLAIVCVSFGLSVDAKSSVHLTNAGALVWQSLVVVVVTGAVAKILLMLAVQNGWIEADGDWVESADMLGTSIGAASRAAAKLQIPNIAPRSLLQKPPNISPTPTPPSLFHEPDELQPQPQPQPPHSGDDIQSVVQPQLVDKYVTFATVCPFCGNPKINRKRPGVCGKCNRNIGVMTERADGERCPACEGIVLKEATFCHHCGKWLVEWREQQRMETIPQQQVEGRQNGGE